MHLHYFPNSLGKTTSPFKKRTRAREGENNQDRKSLTSLTTPTNRRPIYTVRLRPEPNVDAVRMLRQALKVLLRRFHLRAIEVKEEIECN
jgi:hypothetical protein